MDALLINPVFLSKIHMHFSEVCIMFTAIQLLEKKVCECDIDVQMVFNCKQVL